ncbi:MAG: biotin/lipoyl-containing protein [Owenweeksia sp.]|nr:biotin/lipoyl-containing protein [Owenweeksia sp.]
MWKLLTDSLAVDVKAHKKVEGPGDIGAPLQGKLIEVLAEVGQKVAKNDPLFVIEAMKMESTVVAPKEGEVTHIELSPNTMVKQDDLVVRIQLK